MPKFENQIVTSNEFIPELEGLLTLGSIEETEYNNHPKKEIFGKIDGYPIIRYIRFSKKGKPVKSFDLPANTPRDPEDIISWINDAVKNDAVKNEKNKKNDAVKNDAVKNDAVKNDAVKNNTRVKKNKKVRTLLLNGGGKNKRNRTIHKKNKKNKTNKKFRKKNK
jgi:hypothetical protein